MGTSKHGNKTSGSTKCWEAWVAAQMATSHEGLKLHEVSYVTWRNTFLCLPFPYSKDNRDFPPSVKQTRCDATNLLPPTCSAVATAVSRWFPTVAAWVRVRAVCGVCGGQRGTGAGFLRILRFPLPNHRSANFSIIIITRGWHKRRTGGRSAERTQLDSTHNYTN
jgi:hypothetical protein